MVVRGKWGILSLIEKVLMIGSCFFALSVQILWLIWLTDPLADFTNTYELDYTKVPTAFLAALPLMVSILAELVPDSIVTSFTIQNYDGPKSKSWHVCLLVFTQILNAIFNAVILSESLIELLLAEKDPIELLNVSVSIFFLIEVDDVMYFVVRNAMVGKLDETIFEMRVKPKQQIEIFEGIPYVQSFSNAGYAVIEQLGLIVFTLALLCTRVSTPEFHSKYGNLAFGMIYIVMELPMVVSSIRRKDEFPLVCYFTVGLSILFLVTLLVVTILKICDIMPV